MIKDNQKNFNRLHVVIDALLIAGSYLLAYLLRFYVLPRIGIMPVRGEFLSLSRCAKYLVVLIPGDLLFYNICGLYKPKRSRRMGLELLHLFEANILGIMLLSSVIFMSKEANLSRGFYVLFGATNYIMGALFRFIVMKILSMMRKRGINLKHVLLVGYSRAAEGYIDRLRANPSWGYCIYGILDDTMAAGTRYKGVEVIDTVDRLQGILEENSFDEIVITMNLSEYENLGAIVAICEKSGVHTKFVPDYSRLVPSKLYVEDLFGLPVVNIRNVPLSNTANRIIKRIMDICGAALAIVIFSIPMAVVAVIIKLTSPGPVIYKQTRVGLHGRQFKMFKFRSMTVQDPKKEEKEWTTAHDPRVTRVGKFIRKTSIDELPQLFNVLKGEMSLVGPRPERPKFVEKFKEEVPRYMVKHQVCPGMTGWAQIKGYRGDTSIRRRIEHDLFYIENWTVWMDIKILLLTLFKGFISKNAY